VTVTRDVSHVTSTLKRTITKSTLIWVAVLCALCRRFTPGARATSTESTFSVERFSAIAADLNYVLLLGQPLPELLCTAWHISSQPAPSVPLVLSQHIPLISPASHTYFGHLKSIIRLEDSYLVVSVSPESSAYGPFIPESCHIHLPPSFISLPWTHRIHYSRFTSLLSRNKHG